MKIIKCLFASAILCFASPLLAEETTSPASTPEDTLNSAFISDDLFIYIHSGPGTNYRILGTVNSGEEIKVTGEQQNDYSQIVDSKNRSAWVETKYLSNTPGLRFSIAELNGKLASTEEFSQQMDSQLNTANSEISQLTEQSKQLTNELDVLKKQLATSQSKLSNQDMDIKKEWFFNGAIVLFIGLVVGLIIPHISFRKKSSMDSWK